MTIPRTRKKTSNMSSLADALNVWMRILSPEITKQKGFVFKMERRFRRQSCKIQIIRDTLGGGGVDEVSYKLFFAF